MSQRDILHTLEAVRDGALTPQEAMLRLKLEPFQDLGFAKVDHHRELRQGVAEIIYGAGKTPEQIIQIASAMRERGQKTIMITRITPETADEIHAVHPLEYNALAKIDAMPAPFVNNISNPANGEAMEACAALSEALDEVVEAIRNN